MPFRTEMEDFTERERTLMEGYIKEEATMAWFLDRFVPVLANKEDESRIANLIVGLSVDEEMGVLNPETGERVVSDAILELRENGIGTLEFFTYFASYVVYVIRSAAPEDLERVYAQIVEDQR